MGSPWGGGLSCGLPFNFFERGSNFFFFFFFFFSSSSSSSFFFFFFSDGMCSVFLRFMILISGVAPANQTKARPVHELFLGAFRNRSSQCESCLFSRGKTPEFTKKRAKFMNFSFWPFLWFALPGQLLIIWVSSTL